MAKLKPVVIDLKFGLIVGLIIIVTAVIGFFSKWKEFYELVAPGNALLNWRFVVLLLVIAVLTIWFFMNHLWLKEQNLNAENELTIKNLRQLLKFSELEHLMDPITGIPNIRSLKKDYESFFFNQETKPLVQFVFIDLKNFGSINKQFLSQKTNKLIRYIAQNIYLSMRRNENMFKFPIDKPKKQEDDAGFYRIFPGGDEFVFIIEGDQSEAIGFVNRLKEKFEEFSIGSAEILGEQKDISFYCAIVQVDERDASFDDVFDRAEVCYRTVWSGAKDRFALTWFPNHIEKTLSKSERKAANYERARKIFEVIPIVQ